MIAEPAEYKLVDTNVLIVASAEHPESPFASHQTPLEDPSLRQEVLSWLISFEKSEDKLLFNSMIFEEYCNKLGDQDYGRQVVMHKMQTSQYIDIEPDHDGHAVIPEHLQGVIHDLADRKWIATSLEATEQGYSNEIVNACDTDWFEWSEVLERENIKVYHVIEEWCRGKFIEKEARKSE